MLVAGEFKAGKSSLVDALVGHDVCPTDPDVATAVATAVHFERTPSATAVIRRAEGELDTLVIDPADVGDWVTEHGVRRAERAAAGDEVLMVEFGVPADVLDGGVVLIDLPGVGGIGSLAGAVTLGAAAHAHAAVFVSDAGRPLTADEHTFLTALVRRCPRVVLVESRIDIHARWREVTRIDAEVAGPDVDRLVAVSAELARTAGLDHHDGIAGLRAWLRSVARDARRRDGLRLAGVVEQAALELRLPLEAELAVDGDDGPDVAAACLAEQQRVRTAAGRWGQLLADGFADIAADTDHQLRERLRDLVRRGERELAAVDPARAWTEFEPHLRRDVGAVVASHFETLDRRIDELAEQLAQLVAPDATRAALLRRELSEAAAGVTSGRELGDRDLRLGELRRSGLGGQSLTLIRSSYSSALMVGFLGTVVGLTVAAPAVLAVGAVMGTRGLRQENTRQTDHRRQVAAAAVREHVDEVAAAVGKESRDRIRRAQRVLRDLVAAHVQSATRTAAEAVQAAERDAATRTSDRAARRREVAAELERVDTLLSAARQVQAVLAEPRR